MIFKLPTKQRQELTSLFETKHMNIEVAELLKAFWQLPKDVIHQASFGETSHRTDIYVKRMVAALNQTFNTTINPLYSTQYFLPAIRYVPTTLYAQNPYYHAIKPRPKKRGKWSLKYEQYRPFQGFPFADVVVDSNQFFRELTPIGYTDSTFSFLTIQENHTTWMSLTPFEMETMQPVLDQVSGHVLTLGLGLGYFAFMASINPLVTHVTIIERDPKVIELFENHLLTYFPEKKKITIVQLDAFKAMERLANKTSYDHIFVDIYHDAVDGLQTYLKMKPLESLYPQSTFHYWLEDSILALYRRYVLILMEEQLGDITKLDYAITRNRDDDIINHLYHQTKTMVFEEMRDIHSLLVSSGLKALILKPSL